MNGQSLTKNRNIIFAIDICSTTGGIESRLIKLFQYLEREKFTPIIICKTNNNVLLNGYKTLKVWKKYLSMQVFLINLVYRPIVIDIQSIHEKYVLCFEYQKRFFNYKLFYTFHGDYIETRYFNWKYYDKIIFISERLRKLYNLKIDISKSSVITNCIVFKEINSGYIYDANKYALLISRLDLDKEATIESFINFCLLNKIKFKIAGNTNSDSSFVLKIKNKYLLNSNVFIGEINTDDYLFLNHRSILFIGGVGQVALEAINFNLPFYVCSHLKMEFSQFLTFANCRIISEENFTIKSENLNIEFNACEIFKRILEENFEDTKKIKQYLSDNFSCSKQFDLYLSLINNS